MSIEQILSHPFVILIVGAVITGFLSPFLINVWQNSQKKHELALQLKLDLVKRINKSVTDTVMTALFTWRARDPKKAKSYTNRVYRAWEVSSAEIEADIEAYFSKHDVVKSWHDYSEYLKDFYTLSVNPYKKEGDPIKNRQELITRMKTYVHLTDWEGLLSEKRTCQYHSLTELGRAIMNKKGMIVEKILGSDMSILKRRSLLQLFKNPKPTIEDQIKSN